MTENLEKRTWVYTLSPDHFQMAPCKCGKTAHQWSEFKKHLWCDACEIDFIPEHNGIFDGPIPIHTCAMLGITFDRFYFEDQKIRTMDEYLRLKNNPQSAHDELKAEHYFSD